MAEHILTSKHLTFEYPSSKRLSFQDISINKGQHSLLLGDSGTGKTTLLHLLSGLSKPQTGQVHLLDQDIYALKGSHLDAFRAKNLGFIFQEAHLLKNFTVTENIMMAQYLAKYPIDNAAIKRLLADLDLSDKQNSYPQELSRGQMQRVAIARALVNKPALLLADEPTAALDDTNTARVLSLLIDLANTYGSTLLIATHDKRIKDTFTNYYQLT